MKLKIRYENEYQTLDLNGEETDQLWVSLSLDGEGLSQAEREQKIQEAFDAKYNRPEYNSWHKHNRHTVGFGVKDYGGKSDGEDSDTDEPLIDDVADDRIFRRDEMEREERESYDAICQWIRSVLKDKPHWADAFIAIRMDGESVNDYASRTGQNAYNVSKYLTRAEKMLREKFDRRQI